MNKRVETWQLRAQFATALSRMYGTEAPAYTTLVDVSAEVNRDYAAMATRDPAAVWGEYFPATDEEMAAAGLAYYHGGDPSKPVVYEDFLPASAAGIFRSNLDTERADAVDDSDYSLSWMAGQISHHIHDPYELYEKAASQ